MEVILNMENFTLKHQSHTSHSLDCSRLTEHTQCIPCKNWFWVYKHVGSSILQELVLSVQTCGSINLWVCTWKLFSIWMAPYVLSYHRSGEEDVIGPSPTSTAQIKQSERMNLGCHKKFIWNVNMIVVIWSDLVWKSLPVRQNVFRKNLILKAKKDSERILCLIKD